MTTADAFDRQRALERLADDHFDVVVIGGGIAGAGVLLDAANRGLTAALIEADDFASGASSRSSGSAGTGLAHIGCGTAAPDRAAFAEQQILSRTAPHLARFTPTMLLRYDDTRRPTPATDRATRISLMHHDAAGGLGAVRQRRLHRRLTADEAMQHMPSLGSEGLDAATLFYEPRVDDARLTLEIIRTAVVRYGAVAVNRVRATDLHKDAAGSIVGVGASVDGRAVSVRSKVVVNATGAWTDSLRQLDEEHDRPARPHRKRVHLVVPQRRLATDVTAVLPIDDDGRHLTVAPWGEVAHVSSFTPERHLDDVSATPPVCTASDAEGLLAAVNRLTTAQLSMDDVVGSWAAVHPSTTSPGRPNVTTSPSGLVSVEDVTLANYRRSADAAVHEVLAAHGLKRRCRTASLALVGATRPNASTDLIGARHGSNARVIHALVERDASLGEPLVPGLPYLRAEAVHAVRHEMATTLDDVLSRRTRCRVLDRDATIQAATHVAELIASELGWDDARVAAEVEAFVTDARRDHAVEAER